jgi:signal transduction histidine kinase
MNQTMAISTRERQTIRRMSVGIPHDSNSKSRDAPMAALSNAVLQPRSADEAARFRCLEVLAAGIVQEINQPLAALIGNAESCLRMLSVTSLNLEGARDNALRMIKDASRAAAVIQRMWSLFAKTEGNKESVNLNEVVSEALLLSSQKLHLGRVIVRRELEADLPRITGDSLQLQQAILNLIMNGVEAMKEIHDRPRELVVTTQRVDGVVRVSVRDAGAGFSARDAHRLFEAFYTTKAEGMGIGLFLCRWIVESHGGSISGALNDGPGATFCFSIPCRGL